MGSRHDDRGHSSRYESSSRDRDSVRDKSNDRGRQPSPSSTEDDDTLFAGPLSILSEAVKNKFEVVISCHHNKKLRGRVVAFDRHCNMILKKVMETWRERIKEQEVKKEGEETKIQLIARERFLKLMFLRGDSVIVVHYYNCKKE